MPLRPAAAFEATASFPLVALTLERLVLLVSMLNSKFVISGSVVDSSGRGWCYVCGVGAKLRLREVDAGNFGLHAAAKNERSS